MLLFWPYAMVMLAKAKKIPVQGFAIGTFAGREVGSTSGRRKGSCFIGGFLLGTGRTCGRLFASVSGWREKNWNVELEIQQVLDT